MAVSRDAVCDSWLGGETLTDISKENNCSRARVRKILISEGLYDEVDDNRLSPERTERMCRLHLKDLVKVYGKDGVVK